MFNDINKITEAELSEPVRELLHKLREDNTFSIIATLTTDKWVGVGPYTQVVSAPGIEITSDGAMGLRTSAMTQTDIRIATKASLDIVDQGKDYITVKSLILPVIDIEVYIVFGNTIFPPVMGGNGSGGFGGDADSLGGIPAAQYALTKDVPSITSFTNYINETALKLEDLEAVAKLGGVTTGVVEKILTSVGWTGSASPYYQTVMIPEVKVTNCTLIININTTKSNKEQNIHYYDTGIVGEAQADGSVTFKAKFFKPVMDIPVSILYINKVTEGSK